jgi:hypothetical protein
MKMGPQKTPAPAPKLTINIYDVAKDTVSINAASDDFAEIITPAVTHGIVSTAEDSGCSPDEIALSCDVQALSEKLEKSAALILSVLDTARNRGKKMVNWSRAEVNILRKFMFVLSARNSPRWRRFAQSGGMSNESDGENVRDLEIDKFKTRHGLQNARCAWLFSVQHLLSTPHWRIPTSDRILQEDRWEYEEDMRYRQLAIYQAPSQQVSKDPDCAPLECEFPLTESSLGIGEGTSTLLKDDDDTKKDVSFEQEMNLPRPCSSDACKSAEKTSCIPLAKIYAVAPKLAIMLTHVEMVLSDDLSFNSAAASIDSAFTDFPRILTQVTYRPPLSEISLSFCTKEPSLWTPEEIQRESDFRHHQILDGKIVYSRLADGLEVAILELPSSSVWVVNQVLWKGCNEWVVTEKADGMMEAMWEVREKETLSADTIKVWNAAKEKSK